jgi:hypothetical protein
MHMNRHLPLVLSTIVSAVLLVSGAAHAAENMPSREGGEKSMPSVELTMNVEGGAAKCSPAELRLPANSDVSIKVTNQSSSQIVLTAPRIFENKNVLHHDGDVVHVASNDGYTVKQHGKGELRVRTIAEGQYPFGCTSVNNKSEPFQGTLTLSPPGQ